MRDIALANEGDRATVKEYLGNIFVENPTIDSILLPCFPEEVNTTVKTSFLDSPVGPLTTIYFQLCCAEAYTAHSYPFAQGGRKRRTSTHQVTRS
jgi:hypothetical protein